MIPNSRSKSARPLKSPTQEPLVTALARAFHWQELIDSGRYASVTELAGALDVDRSYGARTLHTSGTVRLDMQGQISGPPAMQNLQVQIGGSSIAHANVSYSIQTADEPNQRGAARKVRSALERSLDCCPSVLETVVKRLGTCRVPDTSTISSRLHCR